MKFREHRGSLTDSMATVLEIEPTKHALAAVMAQRLGDYGMSVTEDMIHVYPYGYDSRIGWDAHIVTVNGKAIGFTDGPLEQKETP